MWSREGEEVGWWEVADGITSRKFVCSEGSLLTGTRCLTRSGRSTSEAVCAAPFA